MLLSSLAEVTDLVLSLFDGASFAAEARTATGTRYGRAALGLFICIGALGGLLHSQLLLGSSTLPFAALAGRGTIRALRLGSDRRPLTAIALGCITAAFVTFAFAVAVPTTWVSVVVALRILWFALFALFALAVGLGVGLAAW